MNVAMITGRKEALAALEEGFARNGFRSEFFAMGPHLFEDLKAHRWDLAILDGMSVPFREVAEQLLEADARLNMAVITDMDPQAFHEVSEGLGFLGALPASPGVLDSVALLAKLRAIGGIDPVIETAQANLDAMSQKHHPCCVVCWDRHPFGLKVDYHVTGEHTVEGRFACGPSYEGYAHVIHGGIVSSLLDGAMVSCLLAKGLEAYTIDLRVRYKTAVAVGVPAMIRGEWLRAEGPFHLLQATLEQDGKVRARARAKFFEGTPDNPSQPMPGGAGMRQLLSQARKRLV